MNNTKIKTFTDLKVWQEGHKLVVLVYKITEKFGRQGYKEKLQFYFLSQGSLLELKNFILIARDVGYLSPEDFDILVKQANLTHQLLQGFIQKTKLILNS